MAKKEQSVNLESKLDQIKRLAEFYGLSNNVLFMTTLQRYQVQLTILEKLQVEIENTETTCTKEYVKGRANVYTNPIIKEYNSTSTAANNTISALVNMIYRLKDENIDNDNLDAEMRKLLKNVK